MGLASNVKRLRTDAGMTQAELAKLIGVTRASVTQWETGWSQPRMGALEKLAKTFGVSISELIGEGAAKPSSSMVDVPLFGRIAAGMPIEMDAVEDTQPVPVKVHERHPDAFLLRVEGESMNRVLPNGCFALVDPCDEVERDGAAYALCVNGYDATIKRVRRLANGFELAPDSIDPTFKPKVYDYGVDGTDKVTVIGRVVYYVLPVDWEI